MFKLFLKKSWMGLIIVSLWAILTGISESKVDFYWVKDINVWANAIILELFVFQMMSFITMKIKNQYWQTFISLLVSLIIGETIKYNFSDLNLSSFKIISVLMLVLMYLNLGYCGFKRGVDKGINQRIQEINELSFQLKNMNENEYKNFKKEINRSIKFMKKYPFSAYIIKDSSIEELEQDLKDFDKLRSETNNYFKEK